MNSMTSGKNPGEFRNLVSRASVLLRALRGECFRVAIIQCKSIPRSAKIPRLNRFFFSDQVSWSMDEHMVGRESLSLNRFFVKTP
jgi:hypothetical protein